MFSLRRSRGNHRHRRSGSTSESIMFPPPPAYEQFVGGFFVAGDVKPNPDSTTPEDQTAVEQSTPPAYAPPATPTQAHVAWTAAEQHAHPPPSAKGNWRFFSLGKPKRQSADTLPPPPPPAATVVVDRNSQSFTRSPPPELSYPLDFPPMTHLPIGRHSLDRGFPSSPPETLVVPHPFVSHDVNELDWLTYVNDLLIISAKVLTMF